MKFDPGFIAVGVVIILFYLRLAQIRGRNRKEARAAQLASLRSKSKRKLAGQTVQAESSYPLSYRVGNIYLLIVGVVLMLAGMAMRSSNWFPATYTPYWWVAVVVGGIAFIFCVK